MGGVHPAQARQQAGPYHPPFNAIRSPTTVSVRSLVLQGQPPPPPPGVQRSLRRSRPRGSIGWQRRAAPAPSLRLRPFPRSGCAGRGLRTASPRFRAAARPGSRPAREAETRLALPIRPAPLPRVLGEPDESKLSYSACRARHPLFSHPGSKYPLGRALSPVHAARLEQGRRVGAGRRWCLG